LPTARSGIAAAVLEGRMFVFGGEAPTGTFNQAEAYDGQEQRLEQPCAHANGATRPRRSRGRGQDLRHLGWPKARRLGVGGQ